MFVPTPPKEAAPAFVFTKAEAAPASILPPPPPKERAPLFIFTKAEEPAPVFVPAPAFVPPPAKVLTHAWQPVTAPAPAKTVEIAPAVVKLAPVPSGPTRPQRRREDCLKFIAEKLLLDPTDGFFRRHIRGAVRDIYVDAVKAHQRDMRQRAIGMCLLLHSPCQVLLHPEEAIRRELAAKYFGLWQHITSVNRRRRQGRERRARLHRERAARANKRSRAEFEALELVPTAESDNKRRAQFEAPASVNMADFDKITAGARKALGRADQLLNKADQGRIWMDNTATEPSSVCRQTINSTTAPTFAKQSAQVIPNSHSSPNITSTSVYSDSNIYSNSNNHPNSNIWSKHQSLSTSMAPRTGPAFLSGDPLDESTCSSCGSSTGSRRISTMQSDYFHLKARGIVSDARGLTRKRVRDHEDALRHREDGGGRAERPELTPERAREMVAAALATPEAAGKRARLLGSGGASTSFAPRSPLAAGSAGPRAAVVAPPARDEVDELIARSRRARAALSESISSFREDRLRFEREMGRSASSSGSSSAGRGMRRSFGSGVVGRRSLAGGNSVEDAIEL